MWMEWRSLQKRQAVLDKIRRRELARQRREDRKRGEKVRVLMSRC